MGVFRVFRARAALRVSVTVRAAQVILAAGLLVAQAGCFFNERSFPLRPGDYYRIEAPRGADLPANTGLTTRRWLENAHQQLAPLLTKRGQRVLLTDQMLDANGKAIDVYAWFPKKPEHLGTLRHNLYAMIHTSQSINSPLYIDEPPPDWEGFEQIWIPVADGVELSGRLGLARRDGRVIQADCIVILPGLWGDNGTARNRDLGYALRANGFHVLTLEPRGHGQTQHRFPHVPYNFGVMETQDLMKVSEWLEDRPEVRQTGLIGYCWGANLALLAAWFDGRSPDDPSITPRTAAILDPVSPRRHYQRGIIAFSPALRWEEIVDSTDEWKDLWIDPSPAMLQDTIVSRTRRIGYAEETFSLRRLISMEFSRSVFTSAYPNADGYRFLRLMPYRGQDAGDKLERARVPVLVVQSVNDPLQLGAQTVADLIEQTENPNVAAIILRGGGHIGFQAYNRAYYYSLILNFFDPHNGAAAAREARQPELATKGGPAAK